MVRSTTSASQLRPLMLISMCLLLALAIPAHPARAGVNRNQDIDNTLAQFDDGALQLTSSANFPSSNLITGDQPGAIQLAPIASLSPMTASTGLPLARQDAGVVAVGRNIFVIGGNDSANTPVSSVYVSQVDLSASAPGALGTWNTDPSLPAVKHSDQLTGLIAPRSNPAVAAYVTGQDSGFIYVVGGLFKSGSNSLSSYSVVRGNVSGGRIQSWTAMPDLPEVNIAIGPVGLYLASAHIAQLPNGRTFLYVVGGVQRYLNGPVVEDGSAQIIYTELDGSGSFAGWNTTQYTVPLPGGSNGIWSSAVVGGNFRDANGIANNSNFYILGGKTKFSPVTLTSSIFRADIASDGALTLSNASGAGATNASLGTARTGHAAVQFNGSVYVAGGISQGNVSPNQDVLGSYVQSDRKYPELGGPSSAIYFITRTNPNGLPVARSGHGLVVVPDSFTNPTKGYMYLIGGSDGSTAQAGIFRGTIGDPTATNVSFPLEGYYVSKPVPFTFANSRLKQIFWYTQQPTGANVEITYRISNDANCADLATRDEATAPWQTTNVGSTDGSNAFDLVSNPANCFQYRARLTPTNASSTNATPYLLRLGVVIDVPGATDLTVKSAQLLPATGQANQLQIVLHNENVFLPGEPTLPADYGLNGPGTAQGSFFVDVFIYPPGVTPPANQPIPTTPTTYSRISIDVNRNELQAGPNGTGFDFTIPITRKLCDYNIASSGGGCTVRTLQELFPTVGTYKMVVVVDGDNNVDEQPNGASQAESNNVYGPIDVVVSVPPVTAYYINLPLIAR